MRDRVTADSAAVESAAVDTAMLPTAAAVMATVVMVTTDSATAETATAVTDMGTAIGARRRTAGTRRTTPQITPTIPIGCTRMDIRIRTEKSGFSSEETITNTSVVLLRVRHPHGIRGNEENNASRKHHSARPFNSRLARTKSAVRLDSGLTSARRADDPPHTILAFDPSADLALGTNRFATGLWPFWKKPGCLRESLGRRRLNSEATL